MTCTEYRPDHNGECQNCDEPIWEHALLFLNQMHAQQTALFLAWAAVREGLEPDAYRDGKWDLHDAIRHRLKDLRQKDSLSIARAMHRAGGTHDCGEWTPPGGACLICGKS